MFGTKFTRDETGGSVAEFVLVATVFFMIIFGIIEFGRLLYTHNALSDAARRGARYAALHKEADINCVKNAVVYGDTHLNPATCAPTGPALLGGLTTANVDVVYLGAGGDGYGMNIGTTSVVVKDYVFTINIPLFSRTINMPDYRATMSAESAGEIPPDI